MKNSPFTSLFRQLQHGPVCHKADLHVHSRCSDGALSPAELIAAAEAQGLFALAITDHDCTDAHAAAIAARSADSQLEIVPGVELTCTFRDAEVHLLGYWFDPQNADLKKANDTLRRGRAERFANMVDVLRGSGLRFDKSEMDTLINSDTSLGRRHLADYLHRTGQVSAIFYAFVQHLNRPAISAIPKVRLPLEEGIALLAAAGGVSSWAHPSNNCTLESVRELKALGLNALEVDYPWGSNARGRKLRELATAGGMLVSGGSDFHVPGEGNRYLGYRGLSREEFGALKSKKTLQANPL